MSPLSAPVLAAYLTERAEAGAAVSTLGIILAAVHDHASAHTEPDPTTTAGIRAVMGGLRREYGVAPRRQAHPVSLDELRRILSGIDVETAAGRRDAAVILTGYAGAFRRSEVAALRRCDLTLSGEGIVVRVPRSKSDQEGQGQVVGITRGQHELTDPLRAMRRWLAIRGGVTTDTVFCRITKSGSLLPGGLKGQAVGLILQRRAAGVGLGHLEISGHSLRAGHATTAASHGVPAERLARTTRHKSLEVLSRYIRPARVLGDTTAADLGL